MQRVPLFLSYSKDDVIWLDLVSKHLSPLERSGLVEIWDDRKLRFGDEQGWEEILLDKLRRAGVIVILYSPSFVATDYCQKELQIALQRKRNGEAKVFIIRIRPGNLQDDVAFFQILPPKGRAVSTEPSPDKALEEIVAEIRKEIEPARAAGPVGRVANPSLPYLYNRSDQEDALYKLIVASPDRSKRPLVFLVSGPDQEVHAAFHQRMLADFLPRLLRQPATRDQCPIHWPNGPGEIPLKISRALEPKDSRPESLIRSLPKGISYVTASIYNDWRPSQRQIVEEFLGYWSSFPDLPSTKAVCAAISVEWDKKGPSQSHLEGWFPRTNYPKLRFMALPNLAPPDVDSAPVWVKHPKVTQSYNPARHEALLLEVRSLFAARKNIPMRDLHPKLLDSLRACA